MTAVPRCRVCDAASKGAYLCRACTAALQKAIAELPADLTDLQAVATRQASGPLGLGAANRQWDSAPNAGALPVTPWMFAPGAADQLWAAANTVTTWIRHLCEARGITPPEPAGTWTPGRRLVIERNRARWQPIRIFTPWTVQPLGPLIGWLLTNMDAIRCDEAASQIYEEFIGLHSENRKWSIGWAGLSEYYGRCDRSDVRVEFDDGTLRPVVSTCGADLYAAPNAERIDCQACGTHYTQTERQLALRAELADALGTIREVVAALTRLGRFLTDKAVDSAIRRGQIPVRGHNGFGHRLVRLGDVEAHLLATAKRRKTPAA